MNRNHTPDDRDPAGEADANRIHRQLLGDLAPEEFHLLERDLIESPNLRQRFLRAVRLDVALRDQGFAAADDHPAAPVETIPRRHFGTIAAIAAALVLGLVWIWRATPPASKVAAVKPAILQIATLVDARECEWVGVPVALSQRLEKRTLELAAGVAVIEFDGGARLALQGPSSLELIGPKTARLHRGNATVRCEQGLYSFSLLTPTTTVVDLGTEFGVAVDPEGGSEVHVLDGEVEVVDTVSEFEPGVRFLNAGQTLAMAADGVEEMIAATTRSWVRDYSTPADRAADAQPPRLIARDPFPENFEQPNRFNLGTGWNGAWWQATAKKAGEHRFVPMAPLAKRDGSNGLAMLVGGWVEARRVLAQPLDPTISNTVFVGFSMHRLHPGVRTEDGRMSEGTFLLRSSQDPTAVLGLGLSPLNYWVVAEQGGWERSDRRESGRGPFFVVAKIEFDPLRGNKVSMTGFEKSEDIPPAEPADWDFITRRHESKITVPLDTVALRVRHSAFKFGELSIGNSWEAVVDPSSAED